MAKAPSPSNVKNKFLNQLLTLDQEPNPMPSATVEIHKFFPEGKIPFPEQNRAMDETIKFFADPEARLMEKLMPTGEGKSPEAAACAKAWTEAGGISVIIAPNKELQRQYEKDFGYTDLSIVMGGVEFNCQSFHKKTCGDAKSRRSCLDRKVLRNDNDEPTSACPYKLHQLKAAANVRKKPLCFTPHSFDAFKRNSLLSASLPAGNGLLIVDEAHSLESQLRDFLSISIKLSLVEKIMDFDQSLGGFQGEFFYESSPEEENEEGFPVSTVSENQLVYLTVLHQNLTEKVEAFQTLLDKQDFDSLSKLFPYLTVVNYDDYPNHLEELESLLKKLGFILETINETTWVVEICSHDLSEDDDSRNIESKTEKLKNEKTKSRRPATEKDSEGPQLRLKLRPTIIPERFLKYFFKGFSKIILMSGTLYPLHMQLLGLSPKTSHESDSYKFQTKDSRIPADRRKIYIDTIDGMSVNYKNIDICFNSFLDYILTRVVPKLPGEKGLIHVSSKKQAEFITTKGNQLAKIIADNSSSKTLPAQFITPTKERPWRETYRLFKDMPRMPGTNLFLVAARRYEGIDLVEDLSRICIMLKMPFPHTKDAVIKALEKEFPGYTSISTFVSFVQGMNRTVRTPDDWSLNICLDLMAQNLLGKNLLKNQPNYIKEAISYPTRADWIEAWEIPNGDNKKKTK